MRSNPSGLQVRQFRPDLWAAVALIGLLALGAGSVLAGDQKIKDDWLGAICLDELRRTAETGDYARLAQRVRAAARARLACGGVDELKALAEVVYVLRACEQLPRADKIAGDRSFSGWLVENQVVGRLLMRALAEVSDSNAALQRMHELWTADARSVLAYPDLAVAFATASPAHDYAKGRPAASLIESFQWYTASGRAFPADLQHMPFELSRYLADSRLSLDERAWAVQKFTGRASPAHCYFDVPYDDAAFKRGTRKKIADLPYTLQNIRSVGGICGDQAYFASEVCKAMGLPAAVAGGTGKSGIGHAWVVCYGRLVDRGGIGWDNHTGRYRSHKYYTGRTRDPASGQSIDESELILLGAAAQLPVERREQADAAVYLAKLVAGVAGGVAEHDDSADTAVLTALAAEHDERLAANHRRPKAGVKWIKPIRALDDTLAEDLVATAIQRNMAHRPAWELLVELSAKQRLPAGHLDRFFDLLLAQTAAQYPDYSCLLLLRVIPTVSDAALRLKALQRCLQLYGQRPDLQGRIHVAVGDHFRQLDDLPRAMEAYHNAVLVTLEVPEVLMNALEKSEKVLRDTQRAGQVVALYGDAFDLVAKKGHGYSKAEYAFREGTTYYQVGRRLVAVLMETGQQAKAREVLLRLER